MNEITASEALYGFMGWLTTRQESLSVGAHHECAPAADAIKEFCNANGLAEPRDGWEKNFVHPNESAPMRVYDNWDWGIKAEDVRKRIAELKKEAELEKEDNDES